MYLHLSLSTEMNHESSQSGASLDAKIWTQDLLNTKYPGECIPTLLNQLNLKETFTCKVSFHSAKLRIKVNIEADLLIYCATETWHKPWDKMIANKNIIPHVPRGDVVATFWLITSSSYLATCEYRLLVYHPSYGSCAKKITPLWI